MQGLQPLSDKVCSIQEIEELHSFPGPLDQMTWMVLTVHRLFLDDPSLTQLSFSGMRVPTGEEEPRVLPKLFSSLKASSHLQELRLRGVGLRDADCESLALGLERNSTLVTADLSNNFLEPKGLAQIFSSIAGHTSLVELSCGAQLMEEEVGREEYQVLATSLRTNTTLCKIGLSLKDAHWRDQICRTLIRNREERRKRARSSPSIGERGNHAPQHVKPRAGSTAKFSRGGH